MDPEAIKLSVARQIAVLGTCQTAYDNQLPEPDPDECTHSWIPTGYARLCKSRCKWCGLIRVFEPDEE